VLGPMATPITLAAIGFCIAAAGVGVVYLFDADAQNVKLGLLCFVVVAVGFGTGFVGFVLGWRALFFRWPIDEEGRAARARYASRPEIQALKPRERDGGSEPEHR